ncbi:hypothetical protein [Actinotignum urinale]|uniref:DUF4439 domain-containing protein n=1 Tax=Actinotignum urinale TaxID=190146 RepID=A0AAW9HM89_9ACTO|nr:hypothetical protein [Actinotignum urinale]MDY5154986.1 hypothetical protein [Actinotignum urinale]
MKGFSLDALSERTRHFLQLLGWTVLWILAFTGIMISFGANWETPNDPPAPTVAQQAQLDVSRSADQIARSTTALANQNPKYKQIAEHSEKWKQAVGGLWTPWPQGAPKGKTNPTVAPLLTQPQEIVDALRKLSDQAGKAVTDSPANGAVYFAISVRSALDAQQIAATTGSKFEPFPAPTPETIAKIATPLAHNNKLSTIVAARQSFEIQIGQNNSGKSNTGVSAVVKNRMTLIDALENATQKAASTDEKNATRDVALPVLKGPLPQTAYEELIRACGDAHAPGIESRNFILHLFCDEAERSAMPAMPGIKDFVQAKK